MRRSPPRTRMSLPLRLPDMTIWLLILTVFLAPTKDNPHVVPKAAAVIVSSKAACEAAAQEFVNEASQDKAAQSFGAECVSASDDVQKAT